MNILVYRTPLALDGAINNVSGSRRVLVRVERHTPLFESKGGKYIMPPPLSLSLSALASVTEEVNCRRQVGPDVKKFNVCERARVGVRRRGG